MITVSSAEVFADGFPVDFSIMATLRTRSVRSRVPLFTMYSSESEEVLSVLVGTSIAIQYQDVTGRPTENGIVDFPINIDDEK